MIFKAVRWVRVQKDAGVKPASFAVSDLHIPAAFRISAGCSAFRRILLRIQDASGDSGQNRMN